MISVLLTGRHDYSIAKYLASGGQALAGTLGSRSYRDVFRSPALPAGTYILSDFDRLSFRQLRRLAYIADALQASSNARLLNHPARSLGRFDLLRRLHENGSNPFAVHRLASVPKDVRFPVFLRLASDHQGPRTELLHSHAMVQDAAKTLARRGKPRSDMIVVEFQDTVDARGQYRKYGAFRVADRIVPRHLFFGRQWERKSPANCEDAHFDEEEAYMRDNPHEEQLRAIFTLAGIEYGRIDYAMVDGRICVWEINTNPMISIPEDQTTGRPGVLHALFHERFRQALAEVDTQGAGEIDLRGTRLSWQEWLRPR